MSFEEDKALIEGYNQWKGTRKTNDVSPEAYLLDKAKEDAFDQLEIAMKSLDLVRTAIQELNDYINGTVDPELEYEEQTVYITGLDEIFGKLENV